MFIICTISLSIRVFVYVSTEEEIFKVKKSNYSKKIVNKLKKEYKDDLEKSLTKNDGNSQFSSK